MDYPIPGVGPTIKQKGKDGPGYALRQLRLKDKHDQGTFHHRASPDEELTGYASSVGSPFENSEGSMDSTDATNMTAPASSSPYSMVFSSPKHGNGASGFQEEERVDMEPPLLSRQAQKTCYKRHPEAPKRNRTAYILFLEANQTEVRQKLALTSSPKGTKDVFQAVADLWKTTSKEERQKYEEAAIRDKARYDEELQTYQGPLKVPKRIISSSPGVSRKRKAKKEKPVLPKSMKKPPGAFLLWSHQYRSYLRNCSEPKLDNGQVSKILGAKWQGMTKEEKEPWLTLASVKLEEYLELKRAYLEKVDSSSSLYTKEEGQHQQAKVAKQQQQQQMHMQMETSASTKTAAMSLFPKASSISRVRATGAGSAATSSSSMDFSFSASFPSAPSPMAMNRHPPRDHQGHGVREMMAPAEAGGAGVTAAGDLSVKEAHQKMPQFETKTSPEAAAAPAAGMRIDNADMKSTGEESNHNSDTTTGTFPFQLCAVAAESGAAEGSTITDADGMPMLRHEFSAPDVSAGDGNGLTAEDGLFFCLSDLEDEAFCSSPTMMPFLDE